MTGEEESFSKRTEWRGQKNGLRTEWEGQTVEWRTAKGKEHWKVFEKPSLFGERAARVAKKRKNAKEGRIEKISPVQTT